MCSPEGDFVPLPAVVARLTARSSLPPPRRGLRGQARARSGRSNGIAPAKLALGRGHSNGEVR